MELSPYWPSWQPSRNHRAMGPLHAVPMLSATLRPALPWAIVRFLAEQTWGKESKMEVPSRVAHMHTALGTHTHKQKHTCQSMFLCQAQENWFRVRLAPHSPP